MNKSNYLLLAFLLFATVSLVQAQDDTKQDDGKKNGKVKSAIDKVTKFSQDLITPAEAPTDTLANKFVQDNLSIIIPAVWKDKGTILFNDLKLPKADEAPFNATLPYPKKKIIKGMILTLNTIKKSPQDKKQLLAAQVKAHLIATYKEGGKVATSQEMNEQANSMITGPEKFTTDQGKEGEIYFMHDIQTQQAAYIVLFMVPGATPNSVTFVQFQYYKYNYETTFPDDIMEWRTFVYPDEQQGFVDFSKKIFKSLVIK